ncbi:hypothetical protein AArcSl_1867 [Halalkaliarchaeum desulfuricum]|uniref:SIMPL domain-containing protein n=1 Tax=Halalkaliarchaeum desulfuricum TaxID=2055893 RepID=A0A343TK71_9EURY|nr:SIMPL domain-containing protein [Halalkaliarchaeum desulfuricum]AUX09493.1 hypothetical protein AArcSl_1867 [Halalkaliarchaeum desulfuricum]
MRRRELLAAGGTVAAITLAGCAGTSADDGPNDADGTGNPSVEDVDASGTTRTVIVTNSGEVSDDPDMAVLRAGVESRADTAPEARDEIATKAEELIDALVAYGIDEDDITTRRYYIRDRLDRQAMDEDGARPGDPDFDEEDYTYYQGSHDFEIEIHDVDAVGEVIDVAIDAGADDVGRVTYTLSDDKQADLREEALRQAIEEARSEADTIADEVGAEILEATVVDASEGRVSPVRRDAMMVAEAPEPTPAPDEEPATGIETGEVTVTAEVRIQYEMA